jgi:ketosteroid isomerase-like protein
MLKAISFLLVLVTAAFAQGSTKEEAQVWNLEKAYWDYVKANDVDKYRALWHEDFLGWPFVSSAPVRKDHITDWITSNTSKGVKLRFYSIEQLAIHVTGNVAIDHYRIKLPGPITKEPNSEPTHFESRTRGFVRTASGKSSAACPRPLVPKASSQSELDRIHSTPFRSVFHIQSAVRTSLLVLFTESLHVCFAVRIEKLLAALLPCNFEFGRCDVPVWTALLGNGTQVLAKIFRRGSTEEPVAHVNLVNDKTRLEHKRVRDHRIVVRIGVFSDIEIFLNLAR